MYTDTYRLQTPKIREVHFLRFHPLPCLLEFYGVVTADLSYEQAEGHRSFWADRAVRHC